LFLTESLLIENSLMAEIVFRVHDDALGVCYNNGEKISLQVNHVIFGDMESVKNTILHEIAHALVGNEQGHNEIWQSKAKELGVKFNIKLQKMNVQREVLLKFIMEGKPIQSYEIDYFSLAKVSTESYLDIDFTKISEVLLKYIVENDSSLSPEIRAEWSLKLHEIKPVKTIEDFFDEKLKIWKTSLRCMRIT
jgi:hypothetical protein